VNISFKPVNSTTPMTGVWPTAVGLHCTAGIDLPAPTARVLRVVYDCATPPGIRPRASDAHCKSNGAMIGNLDPPSTCKRYRGRIVRDAR
jgi:hypothetical protein